MKGLRFKNLIRKLKGWLASDKHGEIKLNLMGTYLCLFIPRNKEMMVFFIVTGL